jgi:hypothetical protein
MHTAPQSGLAIAARWGKTSTPTGGHCPPKGNQTMTKSDSVTYALWIVLMLCILAMPLIALSAIFYPEIRAALLA